jgi:hypothetical protein
MSYGTKIEKVFEKVLALIATEIGNFRRSRARYGSWLTIILNWLLKRQPSVPDLF